MCKSDGELISILSLWASMNNTMKRNIAKKLIKYLQIMTFIMSVSFTFNHKFTKKRSNFGN